MTFIHGTARSIALKTLVQNSYSAHTGNIFLSMLSGEVDQLQCMAVNTILAM